MKEDPAVTMKPSFLKDIIKGGTEMTSASRRNEIDFSMSHCIVPPAIACLKILSTYALGPYK